MTRINTCQVGELSDLHLKGEYKEITRVFTNTLKSIEKLGLDGAYKYITDNQPKAYTVRTKDNPKGGVGHEMFFRNRLSYILKRYLSLADEMENRGNNVNRDLVESVKSNALNKIVDKRFWNDYIPTPDAYKLNKQRRLEMGG